MCVRDRCSSDIIVTSYWLHDQRLEAREGQKFCVFFRISRLAASPTGGKVTGA